MTLYKGNAKIKDTGSYGVFKGSQPIGAIYHGSDKVYLFKRVFTWNAGTTLAEYKVPNYVSKIRVDCVASKGQTTRANGGKGGRVQCELNVTGGQSLYITVGNIPTGSAIYNASDIRTNNSGVNNNTSLQSRLVVAGGGGGGSGGGAVYSNVGSGGGGGSSYTDETLCSDVVHTQGYQDGEGYIIISHISDASDYTYKIDDFTAKVVDDNGTYKAFRR